MKVMLDSRAIKPERGHPDDAGLDLKTPFSFWLYSGEHKVVDTGVHVLIPQGYVGLVTSKSSLMGKGITCRGTIDAGYTGSIRAILFNHGEQAVEIHAGDKVCQLIVLPIAIPEIEYVDELPDTERGNGGFGSTGR